MFLSSSLILVATAAAADPLYVGEFLSLVIYFERGLIVKTKNGKLMQNFLSRCIIKELCSLDRQKSLINGGPQEIVFYFFRIWPEKTLMYIDENIPYFHAN